MNMATKSTDTKNTATKATAIMAIDQKITSVGMTNQKGEVADTAAVKEEEEIG